MGTNSPLLADLILFYYERDFLASLFDDKEVVIIQAFNSAS